MKQIFLALILVLTTCLTTVSAQELRRGFKASEEEKLIVLDWLNEAHRKLSQAEFSSTEEAARGRVQS